MGKIKKVFYLHQNILFGEIIQCQSCCNGMEKIKKYLKYENNIKEKNVFLKELTCLHLDENFIS